VASSPAVGAHAAAEAHGVESVSAAKGKGNGSWRNFNPVARMRGKIATALKQNPDTQEF